MSQTATKHPLAAAGQTDTRQTRSPFPGVPTWTGVGTDPLALYPVASSIRILFFMYRTRIALYPQTGPIAPLLPYTRGGGAVSQVKLSSARYRAIPLYHSCSHTNRSLAQHLTPETCTGKSAAETKGLLGGGVAENFCSSANLLHLVCVVAGACFLASPPGNYLCNIFRQRPLAKLL